MRPQEEPFADMSMWMRIALHSDFAFVAKPLVAFDFTAAPQQLSWDLSREPSTRSSNWRGSSTSDAWAF